VEHKISFCRPEQQQRPRPARLERPGGEKKGEGGVRRRPAATHRRPPPPALAAPALPPPPVCNAAGEGGCLSWRALLWGAAARRAETA